MPRLAKPTPQLDSVRHLMGTQPDREIADQCGSTASIVGRYRRRHGIPAYEGYKFGKGQVPPIKRLRAGQDKRTRRRRSKIDAFKDAVGIVPDAVIARKAGVTVEGVRMYRKRNGIPLSAGARKRRNPGKRIARQLADVAQAACEVAAQLDRYNEPGKTVADGEAVTKEAGVRGELAVLMPQSPPISNNHRRVSNRPQGFVVSVDSDGETRDYVIVSASLSAAVDKATQAVAVAGLGARVVGVRAVGPILV